MGVVGVLHLISHSESHILIVILSDKFVHWLTWGLQSGNFNKAALKQRNIILMLCILNLFFFFLLLLLSFENSSAFHKDSSKELDLILKEPIGTSFDLGKKKLDDSPEIKDKYVKRK